jgi:hypothetical protein
MIMVDEMQPGRVVPSPRIPKVLGILNIVFGSVLILFGLCMGLYFAMLPAMSRAMTQMQQKAEADVQAKNAAELKTIGEAEKAAKTEEEKEALADQRKAIEARPKITIPMGMDFGKLGFDDPKFQAYYWTELSSALILNILMIVAGIALVQRKMWGLSLGLWTAAAKIVRLVLVYSYFGLVLVPPFAQKSGELAGEMMIQQQQAMGRPAPPGFDTKFMVKIYTIMYSVTAVVMIGVGSIYPAISIWLLTRPGARAACDESRLPPGQELNETW